METVSVELGQRSYPILIAPSLLTTVQTNPLHSKLQQYQRVVIISNPTVAALYLPQVEQLFPHAQVQHCLVPDGEAYKTLASFENVSAFLLEHKFPRDGLLVALGGGVIGDLTGFVAACYQRGVDFVQIPTTLLSQVDSSVGGKTAVNHPLGKNMIGAFKQPQAVMIDTNALASLPAREIAAGMAEVIKYGLLGDAEFSRWLLDKQPQIADLDASTVGRMIAHCCQMKADIVARDETEQGDRALLNLGHTFGHAIEAWLGYGTWLHGEAVGAGMMMAAKLSCARGWITATDCDFVEQLLQQFQLPICPPPGMQIEHFIPFMKTDKKVKSGKMRFVLLRALGQAVLVDDVTEQELLQVFGQSHG